MIKITNLTKSIAGGSTVLAGITVNFFKGDFVAILGASGSGKTTLLRCLSMKERWDQGKLSYDGKEIMELGLQGKRIIRKEWSYMADQPLLNLRLNAHRNVLSGSRKHRSLIRLLTGTVPHEEYEEGMDYLIQAGLMRKSDLKVGEMSGGERQRVALAKALAEKPKVILADEPVNNLDPQTARSILEIVANLCKDEKLIFICTISQVELAEQYATRILGLRDGGIAFDVSGRRLTQQEKNMVQ